VNENVDHPKQLPQNILIELPLEISKTFLFTLSEKEKLKTLIENFQFSHQNHLIATKTDYNCLMINTFGIVNNFLSYFYIHGALIKMDKPLDNLANIPINNQVCLVLFKTQFPENNFENKDLKNLSKDLQLHCHIANKEIGKGIIVSENSWYLSFYGKTKEKISVTKPLKYFEIEKGKIKVKENYVDFFEMLISFIKN
jgi:hypothetical protein